MLFSPAKTLQVNEIMFYKIFILIGLSLLFQNVVSKDRYVQRELFVRKQGDTLLANVTLYSDWSVEAENHRITYVWESDIQLFTYARVLMPSDV